MFLPSLHIWMLKSAPNSLRFYSSTETLYVDSIRKVFQLNYILEFDWASNGLIWTIQLSHWKINIHGHYQFSAASNRIISRIAHYLTSLLCDCFVFLSCFKNGNKVALILASLFSWYADLIQHPMKHQKRNWTKMSCPNYEVINKKSTSVFQTWVKSYG